MAAFNLNKEELQRLSLASPKGRADIYAQAEERTRKENELKQAVAQQYRSEIAGHKVGRYIRGAIDFFNKPDEEREERRPRYASSERTRIFKQPRRYIPTIPAYKRRPEKQGKPRFNGFGIMRTPKFKAKRSGSGLFKGFKL